MSIEQPWPEREERSRQSQFRENFGKFRHFAAVAIVGAVKGARQAVEAETRIYQQSTQELDGDLPIIESYLRDHRQ